MKAKLCAQQQKKCLQIAEFHSDGIFLYHTKIYDFERKFQVNYCIQFARIQNNLYTLTLSLHGISHFSIIFIHYLTLRVEKVILLNIYSALATKYIRMLNEKTVSSKQKLKIQFNSILFAVFFAVAFFMLQKFIAPKIALWVSCAFMLLLFLYIHTYIRTYIHKKRKITMFQMAPEEHKN